MRIKIAATLGNRDSTTDKDERILNGLVENDGGRRREDKSQVLKRPATVTTYSLAVGQGSATQGQGLFVMNLPGAPGVPATNTLIGIRGDVVTTPVS